jgi:poly-gamma-glutamate synthesis protein (capsule biosynthesis protein)
MINIVFVGDIMLSRNVGNFLKKNNKHKIISDELVNILNKSDLCIGNLESPVSNKDKIVKKNGFCAEYQTLMQIEKINMVSLGNNHVFDCGIDGVFDTINRLKDVRIKWSGVIDDHEDIVTPVEYNVKNKKIAIYSCVVDECIGNDDRKNNIKLIKISDKRVQDSIKKYKSISDIIIVLIHGGNEMISYPQPSFKKICRQVIENGADMVVTTHPHVLGGFEEYMGKYIFYSMGDFIFDADSYIRKRSGVLSVTINREIQWNMIPIVMDEKMRIVIAFDTVGDKIIKKYKYVSKKIVEKDYEKKYKYYYVSDFIIFQIDRLYYKIKTKGILEFMVFLFSKMKYVVHYMKKIIYRQYI